MTRNYIRPYMQKGALLFAAFTCVILATGPGCAKQHIAEHILLDFETDHDLNKLHWRCHVLFSISDQYAVHGDRSLRFEVYPPAKYPGMSFLPSLKDWRSYRSLCFEVYNPYPVEETLVLRIDDRRDNPDFKDRFNRQLQLVPGMNHFQFPLESLCTSGTNRQLDLSNIERLMVFKVEPSQKRLFFLDYFRLSL